MEMVFDGGGGASGANDWRSQIREETRKFYISTILRALIRELSSDESQTFTNLCHVAARVEQRIYQVAVNKVPSEAALEAYHKMFELALIEDMIEAIAEIYGWSLL